MTYERMIEIKTLLYDLTIDNIFNDKPELSLKEEELQKELDDVPEEEMKALTDRWEKEISERMALYDEELMRQQAEQLKNEGLMICEFQDATIVRLCGKVTETIDHDNGNVSFRIGFPSIDVYVSNLKKDYPAEHWMKVFDEHTGKYCKKCNSDFGFTYLKKIS